jgi:PAS domain S-box-containing protein
MGSENLVQPTRKHRTPESDYDPLAFLIQGGKNENKYRTIVETANEGIVIADLKSATTYVNSGFTDMLGVNPEKLFDNNTLIFFDKESHGLALVKCEDRMLQRTKNCYEARGIRKDESLISVLVLLPHYLRRRASPPGLLV